MGGWWQWFRSLKDNPVYQREKGLMGEPNPFYSTLSRYSPFVVIGAIVLGLCTGFNNPALFGNDNFAIAWCLLCLPGALLSMVTVFGTLMAPTLTAPSISLELNRGTWEILRLTPQPTGLILFAKLFGALSRLKIWFLLFFLSAFQGLVLFGVSFLAEDAFAILSLLLALTAVLQPTLHILFAAFVGMFVSTWTRSAPTALVGSYAIVILFRIIVSIASSVVSFAALDVSDTLTLTAVYTIPVFIYAISLPLLAWGIYYRAEKISS